MEDIEHLRFYKKLDISTIWSLKWRNLNQENVIKFLKSKRWLNNSIELSIHDNMKLLTQKLKALSSTFHEISVYVSDKILTECWLEEIENFRRSILWKNVSQKVILKFRGISGKARWLSFCDIVFNKKRINKATKLFKQLFEWSTDQDYKDFLDQNPFHAYFR